MRRSSTFVARRLRIESLNEPIALIHTNNPVARSEGLAMRAQIEIAFGGRTTIARLYQDAGDMVAMHEVGLSEPSWSILGVHDGDKVELRHPPPLASLSAVRAKLYGHRLDDARLSTIINDIGKRRYSDVQIAAFVAAFASHPPDVNEMAALTRAMVAVGDRMAWDHAPIVDKHCIGGLPGNRTTPIVVAIAAAAGLTIPKTSSRAITSAAGTADMMETMTRVDLDGPAMRRVVEQEGGCLVWGGGIRLSPADDVIIRVERTLDLDAQAQMVASVLSKKLAAGSTHVVIDIPVGPTAKVRTASEATELCDNLKTVASRFGMAVETCQTDGTQPVGRGIGPCLEARDVLQVLRGHPDAPSDLRDRALRLAGAVMEIGKAAKPGSGVDIAEQILADGRALRKFIAICEAQGGFREPATAPLTKVLQARKAGLFKSIDNRRLSRLAKLSGAPRSPAAGLDLHVRLGDRIAAGQPLMTIHGQSEGELDYALAYAGQNPDIIEICTA